MAHAYFALPTEEALLLLGQQLGAVASAAQARSELDALGARLQASLDGSKAQRPTEALRKVVYEDAGFRGNREDYYAPANSLLADVIATRRGLPITLATVLTSVARRAGLQVEGVAFPGHFLARVGGEQNVLIDPFNEGHEVSEPELEQLAQRFLGDVSLLREAHLAVATSEDIVVRSLVNLQHAYRKRGLFAMAMLVSDKLVELTESPEHIRDRGLLAIALGSNETAEGDLSAYLAARPYAKDVPTLRVALDELRKTPKKALQ